MEQKAENKQKGYVEENYQRPQINYDIALKQHKEGKCCYYVRYFLFKSFVLAFNNVKFNQYHERIYNLSCYPTPFFLLQYYYVDKQYKITNNIKNQLNDYIGTIINYHLVLSIRVWKKVQKLPEQTLNS
ncbi:hypothetical protein ABPG72_017185 [Tetrahymena utriculariae]